MTAIGNSNIKDELKKGKTIDGQNYKVYINGYNNLGYWTGKTDTSKRNHIFYYYESNLTAIRLEP